MIIIAREGQTHFVNEKNYDVISHYLDQGKAVCLRGDQTEEYYHVTGVAYIPDGDKTRYESGFLGGE